MHDAQKVRFWIAAALLTALNVSLWLFVLLSSSDPHLVRLSYSTPVDAFERSGRLELAFDRDLYPQLVPGTTIEDGLFTFEPNVEGSWIAITPDTIAFEPVDPPPSGHTYTVGLTPDHPLLRTIHIDTDTLPKLHYRPLKLLHTQLDGSSEVTLENGKLARRSTIALHFNQDVARADCAQHVHIATTGGPIARTPNNIEPQWTSDSVSKTHHFEVVTPLGKQLRIRVDMALTGHGGELPLGTDRSTSIDIPAGLAAIRVDTDEFRRGYSKPEVEIRFNRPLSPTQKTPVVHVTPDIGPVATRISGQNLLLRGRFAAGVDYVVDIEPPLVATDGSTLSAAVTRSVRIPKGSAWLSFPHYSGRLGMQGAFELDLNTRGVDEAHLRIYRLLDRHIPIYLSGIMSDGEVPRLGELITETTLHLDPDGLGSYRMVAVALDEVMERTPGIYRIEINDPDSRWTRDSMLLFVGDLTIDVQTHAEGMLAWVTDTRTGLPVEGATVTAWSTNRVELETGTTDADGLLALSTTSANSDLVTAQLQDDLIFIHPRQARGIDDRALSGAPWSGPLDVALYADRGVHRPGEIVHLSGVVRTAAGDTPGALPLEIRFTRPDHRVMVKQVVTTDPNQSMFHIDLTTTADSMTGNWRASVHLAGDDDSIASLTCPVMPVLPVRLAVHVTPLDADGDAPVVEVQSTYLHGAPAGGLPATAITTFTPQRYSDDRFSSFRFEDPPSKKVIKRLQKATLGDDGTVVFTIDPPIEPALWRGELEATVSELGGRATTARTRVYIDTAKAHLGLRAPAGKLYRPTDTIPLEAIRLDAASSAVSSGTIVGKLNQIDNEWQLVETSASRRQWRSVEIVTPVANINPVFVAGDDNRWTCELPALVAGTYRFTASIPRSNANAKGAKMVVTIPIHVSQHAAAGRVAAHRLDRLELIVEHDLVTPGMETSVLIRTPFPGLALVTMETDEIKHAQVVHIDGDGARVPITVPQGTRDTCFVGATLLRPLDPARTQWLPLRARGAARLHVDRRIHELAASLHTVDAARPGDTVHVTLRVPLDAEPIAAATDSTDETDAAEPTDVADATNSLNAPEVIIETPKPPASVHLWAVEEGALLLTDYTVPNLANAFLRERRRVVAQATTIDKLLPDFERPVTVDRIGSDIARRFRSPVPIRQRQIEVLWHDSMPLPADGVLELDLAMPQLDGAMRLMAIVIDGDRFGRTEHLVGVTSPLDLTAALPRAVAPGDSMDIPVTLHNRQSAAVELTLALDHADIFTGTITPQTLNVPAGGSATAMLHLSTRGLGAGRVQLTATPGTGDVAELSGTITVRPPHGRVRDVVRMVIEPGETVPIERRRDLDALSGHIDIVVAGMPAVDLAPVIQDLIDYPWGCAEQTGSRTQGLLAALRLPVEVTGLDRAVVRELAEAGFDRLWHMQNRDGSLGYWRGQSSNAWITLRTALLALDARTQSVAIPEDLLDGLLEWTRANARSARDAGNDNIAAMACRVLARADKPDEALMKSLASNSCALPASTRAHLADAAAAVGDTALATSLLKDVHIPRASQPHRRFHSANRDAAIVLDVLLRNAMEHPRTVDLVRQLNDSRNARGWRTTFDNAAAVDALSRWHASVASTGTAKGRLTIAGKTFDIDGNAVTRYGFDVTGGTDALLEQIQSTGDGPITVLIATSGVPSDVQELPALESVIRVRRIWRDALGEPIWVNTKVNAGDLITVDLSIVSTDGSTWHDVALLDVLPGGMEFELPSLATSAGSKNVKLADVDRVEFRDDRVVAFLTVDGRIQHLKYVLRAVVPGEFAVPAVDALAMYDPDGHGRSIASSVRIDLP